MLTRMLRFLGAGDLVLGDRGLVSFAHLATFMAAGVHCLCRLPRGPFDSAQGEVAFQLRRPGFRSPWVWVVTTLTCPDAYAAAAALAELYGKRWRVELGFRDLKRTLGMAHLTARSADGCRRKQVPAFVVLYNLVRRLMGEAARRQGVPPDRVSFADAATALLWRPAGGAMPALRVNPPRVRPSQPRARKHGGYRYPVLGRPRSDLQRPPAVATIGKAAA